MAEFRVPFSGQILNGVIYVSEPGSLKSTAAPDGLAHSKVLSNDAYGVPIWIDKGELSSDAAARLAVARLITIGNQSNAFDGSANITYTLDAIGAVAKAGDTMTGSLIFSDSNIGIRRPGRNISWVQGRDGALIATTTISGYSPIISTKTTNGSWDIGANTLTAYEDRLVFSYVADTDYTNNATTTPTQIQFLTNGHIQAALDGNATSATRAAGLTTARTLITDLASTTAASFNGTANVELGVKGVLDPSHGGTGEITLNDAGNAIINALPADITVPSLNDYYVAQFADGGTTNITYQRRTLSALYTLFKTQMADNGVASAAKKWTTARNFTICGVTKSVDGSGNVEWTANELGISGYGHTHYYLEPELGDHSLEATIPNDYDFKFSFMGVRSNSVINNPSNDTYSTVIGLRGYEDSTRGDAYELAVNDTGIFLRSGTTTAWGNWYRFVMSSASGTVGNNRTPIYLNNGVLQAFSSSIGSSTQFVYINQGSITATTDTVGSIYNPVYMNAGVMTELTGLIQKKDFEIANNTNTVELSHDAYTSSTIVIQIVITSGERNLQAPINWSSSNGKVTLSTRMLTTGAVSGYIITARGVEL